MGGNRDAIAARVARHLADGSFVNVGIGLPGMVPDHVPDERGILFHAEHGVIGFGAASLERRPDRTVLGFFANRYTLRAGAAVVDHPTSFALVRAGLLDATVLGAFEVAADGTFAGHQNDVMPSAGVGGAPELAGACATVLVALEHNTAAGAPRLVQRCRLPVGLPRRVELVVTELGAFRPAGDGFAAVELADGVGLDEVRSRTGAPVHDELDRGRAPVPPRRGRVDRRRSKVLEDPAAAVAVVRSGMTVAIGGWGGSGTPHRLVTALALSGVRDLTIVCAGVGPANDLIAAGCVRHAITSFASYAGRNSPSAAFDELCRQGRVTAELCSQGVLAERLRAGGAGIAGFYVAADVVGRFRPGDHHGLDTVLRTVDGREHTFHPAIRADVALVGASVADPFGNLAWVDGERNYNAPAAMAAEVCVAEADALVALGELDPHHVMVPGAVVDTVVAPLR
ncbi:MAG: 3-oxoacid CoA-transferase subunit A [Acidimicrobiales bacterium]